MIIAVTGHRPPRLGGYWVPNPVYDAVKAGLLRKFRELQPELVLTGMALGVDQWAAEICMANGIPYDAIIPFEGYESRWPDASKRAYYNLLSGARSRHVVTNTSTYSTGLLQRRNAWMVDHSALLLAVWNGSASGTGNCINYARQRNKPVVLVDLPEAIWAQAAEREAQTAERLNQPRYRRPQPAVEVSFSPPRQEPQNNDPTLLTNIFRPDRSAIPSPLKEDYKPSAKAFTPGRIIDLDD